MFFWNSSCFFDDPADVGNLISCSSAFSKSILNIWKFTVHALLKLGLENFKQEEFQKNIYFCFIDYAKAFYYVDHNKLWKILKEMGIPDHLTCLLRILYAGQETIRIGHGTTDWLQIWKGVGQSCILSPC